LHCLDNAQCRPHGPLRVVFVRYRIAEIHQQPIPEILRHVPREATNHRGARLLIGTNDLPQILGIKLLRESGGAYQVTEHYRQLPAFAGIPSRV
jgi:hypothetical protein